MYVRELRSRNEERRKRGRNVRGKGEEGEGGEGRGGVSSILLYSLVRPTDKLLVQPIVPSLKSKSHNSLEIQNALMGQLQRR